jgi:hypothetical protein
MTDQNNPLGMKSIQEAKTQSPTQLYGEIMKKAFTHDWIFSKFYEKLIVAGSFFWAVYSVVMLIWRLI